MPPITDNIHTKGVEGDQVQEYGAYILHTFEKEILDYVDQLAEFNSYTNSPVANYKGEIYDLSINMISLTSLKSSDSF